MAGNGSECAAHVPAIFVPKTPVSSCFTENPWKPGERMYLTGDQMDKGTKKSWRKRVVRAIKAVAIAAFMVAAIVAGSAPVFASGGAGVVTGINTLKDTLITIIQAVGVVVIVWGVFELGKAFTQHDSASKIQAMGPIIGGAIMVAASIVVSLFV